MKFFFTFLFLINGYVFADTLELEIDKICKEKKKDLIELNKILLIFEEKQVIASEQEKNANTNADIKYKELLDWFLINTKVYKELSCYERRGTVL